MIKSKFTNMFKRFLFSYVAILLVPLITGFISYYAAIDLTKSHSIESSLSVLNTSKSVLEQRMAEVEAFTRQLAIDPDLNRILHRNGDHVRRHAFELWKAAKDVSGFARTNEYLQHFYIYLHHYDVVLTPGFVFYRPDHFYELIHEKNVSFEEWKQSLQQVYQSEVIPSRTYIRHDREVSITSFMQSLPLNSFNEPLGTVVVNMESWKISQLLDSFSKQFGGWAMISDQKGNIIASKGIDSSEVQSLRLTSNEYEKETSYFFEDDTLFISIRSANSGWIYAAGIPKETIFESAGLIKRITLSVTGGTLLIGLLFCLWLAYRNCLPVYRLIDIFKEHGSEQVQPSNEYDFLKGSISRLLTNNQLLKVEIERQVPILKDAVIKRLLNGDFFMLGRIKETAELDGIHLRGDRGYVAIVQIDRFEGLEVTDHHYELHAIRIFMKQLLCEEYPDVLATDLQSDKMVLVFTYDDYTEVQHIAEQLESRLKNLRAKLEHDYRILITASIGGFFQNLSDLNRSYEEAKQAIHYAASMMNDEWLLWYRRTSHENHLYYYPVHMELRLLDAIRVAESTEAIRILEQLFEQNFEDKKLSVEMAHLLIEEMKATLLKSFDRNVMPDPFQIERIKNDVMQIQWTDGIDKIMDDLKQMVKRYCKLVIKKQKETDVHMIQEVCKYLEENYANPDLTIHMIAEKVRRPEKVVSQLFKDQTGEYVSEYLEQIRLNEAAEWLRSSNEAIQDIAHRVGYNSPHSFRRAFKRHFDMSPNQYRTMLYKKAKA